MDAPAPIALVTGAGRGIGRAIAERLSRAGLRVALTARSDSREQARQALAGRQPIGRLITPDEVAAAVWFCIGNGALTGQGINVDGGTVQS